MKEGYHQVQLINKLILSSIYETNHTTRQETYETYESSVSLCLAHSLHQHHHFLFLCGESRQFFPNQSFDSLEKFHIVPEDRKRNVKRSESVTFYWLQTHYHRLLPACMRYVFLYSDNILNCVYCTVLSDLNWLQCVWSDLILFRVIFMTAVHYVQFTAMLNSFCVDLQGWIIYCLDIDVFLQTKRY